jgi:hypothetical protein
MFLSFDTLLSRGPLPECNLDYAKQLLTIGAPRGLDGDPLDDGVHVTRQSVRIGLFRQVAFSLSSFEPLCVGMVYADPDYYRRKR